VHATAVTAGQSMPAGQLSVRTMASCYNCCAHSLPGPQYLSYLFVQLAHFLELLGVKPVLKNKLFGIVLQYFYRLIYANQQRQSKTTNTEISGWSLSSPHQIPRLFQMYTNDMIGKMWIGKISFCLLLWQSITLMSSALNRTQTVRLC